MSGHDPEHFRRGLRANKPFEREGCVDVRVDTDSALETASDTDTIRQGHYATFS